MLLRALQPMGFVWAADHLVNGGEPPGPTRRRGHADATARRAPLNQLARSVSPACSAPRLLATPARRAGVHGACSVSRRLSIAPGPVHLPAGFARAQPTHRAAVVPRAWAPSGPIPVTTSESAPRSRLDRGWSRSSVQARKPHRVRGRRPRLGLRRRLPRWCKPEGLGA